MSLYTSQPSNNNISPSKQSDTQKSSRVLLVCVYDTIVFEITNDLVYQRFHQFGNVLRILIFDRREVTKLFVEFQSHDEAFNAKQYLDGKKLCNNICKMSIYFSTFENVDLKHNTTQGIEFYGNNINQNQTFSYNHFDNYSTNSQNDKSPTKKYDDFDEFSAFGICGVHRLGNFSADHSNSFLPRSKTANNEIQWHINQVNKRKNIWGQAYNIDQAIKSDIDSILNCQSNSPEKWSTNSQTNGTPKGSPKLKSNHQQQDEKLTVIGFKTKNILKHLQIYNLFSNFGNISMIIIKKNEVKIKFRTVQFAAIAKNYLNNTWLNENKIQLHSYPSNSCWPEEGEYCQIICYDQSTDRFTQKKSITINPPSKTLHISGMKKQKCTLQEISNMFKHVVEPIKVKVLKQNADKNMALVEFSSLEDSFDVVANCHNMLIGGRKIQISFTKSQI